MIFLTVAILGIVAFSVYKANTRDIEITDLQGGSTLTSQEQFDLDEAEAIMKWCMKNPKKCKG